MTRFWRLTVLLLFVCHNAALAGDKPCKLDTQLIWGTDQAKPNPSDLKDISPELRKKLCKVFKWKNYFEVSRKEVQLPQQACKRIRMSPKCELEFDQSGANSIEVKLYGENKLVVTKKQVLVPGEPMVLAGDDKNDSAWFVVITGQAR
jgi:hypothetical protein